MEYLLLTIIGGAILFLAFLFMPLNVSIKQKATFVVLAIIFSHLFLILHSYIPEWQAGVILIFTILISTYLFVKYISSDEKEEIPESHLLTEPSIDGEFFQEVFTNERLTKENTNQLNTYEVEEESIEKALVEVEQTDVATKAGEQGFDVEEDVIEEGFVTSEKESAATSEESVNLEVEESPEVAIEAAKEEEVVTEAEAVEEEEEVVTEAEAVEEEEEVATEAEAVEEETEIVTEAEAVEEETEVATEPEAVEETEVATEPEAVEEEEEVATEPEAIEEEEEVATEPEAVEEEEEVATEPEAFEEEEEVVTEAEAVEEEEEVATEPEAFEEETEVVTEAEPVTFAKRLNRDLMDTLVEQLLWYKNQLNDDQYEQLIIDHAKDQLHDNDYYLFASMLRNHYIKTEQFDKLKGLLTKLKQRYNNKIVILEEITFFEEKFFRS